MSVLGLMRDAWVRFLARTVDPTAPADVVLPIAIALADLRRK